MILPEKSIVLLNTVKGELRQVILEAAANVDSQHEFVVTEGIRNYARQLKLFTSGASKTMNSRHLTGHAVDLAIWEDRDLDRVVDSGELNWKKERYTELALFVKSAAAHLGISIRWGGDFNGFFDGPHFELDRRFYP